MITQLLKIEEINHLDIDGNILWRQENIGNVFHTNGHLFLLGVAFRTSDYSIPASYYLGLDNRTPDEADTILSISGEPSTNGYTRQAVSSANGFTISNSTGNYRATSSVVTFTASGGSWGPVKTLFLATGSASSGYLITSSVLDSSRTLTNGQSVTMRVSAGLTNC